MALGHGDVLEHVVLGPQLPVTVPAHAPPVVTHMSPLVHERPSLHVVPAGNVISGKVSVASSHAPYMAHGVDTPLGTGMSVRMQPRPSRVASVGRQRSTPVQYAPSSHAASLST